MARIEFAEAFAIEWSIDNVTCWNAEIHGKVLKSSDAIDYDLKLFPRGPSGEGEHLELRIHRRHPNPSYGYVSFIGSDGTIFCTQHLDSEEELLDVHEFPPGPKFRDVVAHIRKNEAQQGDRITLRIQSKGCDSLQYLRTTIVAFDASFKCTSPSGILQHLTAYGSNILRLMYPLDGEGMGRLELAVSKDKFDESRIILKLRPEFLEKKISVLTSMTVLSNRRVVRTEEKEHLFRDDSKWKFSNSLMVEEVGKEGFSLILNLKIISSTKLRHSGGYYAFYSHFTPAFTFIPSSIFRAPDASVLKDYFPVSNPTVFSLKNLSEELMCLYKDQEFSDFQLKCDNVSFPVHRNILSARSPVFKSMLSCDMQEAASGCMEIVDVDPATLARFLTFLYTGAVGHLERESALNLYYVADKYQVSSLKRECVSVILSGVSISNVCDILSLADKHKDDQLRSTAHDFILENYNEVLRSEEWRNFMRKEPLLVAKTLTQFTDKNVLTIKTESKFGSGGRSLELRKSRATLQNIILKKAT